MRQPSVKTRKAAVPSKASLGDRFADIYAHAIVAMAADQVIGPELWASKYPADRKRFKRLTDGHVVIMGRKTWEVIPEKFRPLPNRVNFVVSAALTTWPNDVCKFLTLPGAIWTAKEWYPEKEIWIIGGASIYAEALRLDLIDRIDVTHIPESLESLEASPQDVASALRFPEISPVRFMRGALFAHEDDPRLQQHIFTRREV